MNTVEGANRIDLASNIRGADMTTGAWHAPRCIEFGVLNFWIMKCL